MMYFLPPMTDIQCTQFLYKYFLKYALTLQVIDEMGHDFGGLIKSKHSSLLQKLGDFLRLISQIRDFTRIQKNYLYFFKHLK